MGVEIYIVSYEIGSGFGEPGGTHPPRIPRGTHPTSSVDLFAFSFGILSLLDIIYGIFITLFWEPNKTSYSNSEEPIKTRQQRDTNQRKKIKGQQKKRERQEPFEKVIISTVKTLLLSIFSKTFLRRTYIIVKFST